MKLFLKTITLAVVMALFTACGSDFEFLPDTNTAPVANAGANQSVVVGDTVTLDGSVSSDEDRDSLTYGWSIISRPVGSIAPLSNTTIVNPTFTPDVPGEYVLSLTVNDGEASSVPSTVKITASVGNAPPVANAGVNQSVVTGTVVTLDGSGSSDTNGDTLTYSWTITSLPSGSTATLSSTIAAKPTFTADKDGDYVFSLMVDDGKASSVEADSVTVTAATGNAAPVANAGLDQNVVTLAVVTLNGSGTDANGDPLTYAWTITSVPPGSTVATISNIAKPSFTADKDGSYVFSLIVNDGKVSSAADSVTVIVDPFLAVVAKAGADQNVALNQVVTLDGSASTDKTGTADVNGDKLKYTWSFASADSKPTGAGSVVLTGANTVHPTFNPTVTGTYKISLQVNDLTDPTADGSTDEVVIRCNLGSITVTW